MSWLIVLQIPLAVLCQTAMDAQAAARAAAEERWRRGQMALDMARNGLQEVPMEDPIFAAAFEVNHCFC